MSYDDDEESKQSVFNAGVAKAERIDSLQRALNASRFNLTLPNFDTGTYNYDVMLTCLETLRLEAWAKGTKVERVYLDKIRKHIDEIKEKYCPYKECYNIDGERELVWDNKKLNIIKKILVRYEEIIRDVLDAHALDAPNKDYDDDYI